MQRPRSACHPRSVPDGSGKLTGCHRSSWFPSRPAISRSKSARRSQSCSPRGTASARSLDTSAVRRRRSPGNFAGTRRHARPSWSTGRPPSSGTPSDERADRRSPSSPPTIGSASTSKTGSPARSSGPTAAWCLVPTPSSSAAGTAGVTTGAAALAVSSTAAVVALR